MNKSTHDIKQIVEKLAQKWIASERQYRSQVAEARKAGTPCAGMLAHADQLAECRRELQVAFYHIN